MVSHKGDLCLVTRDVDECPITIYHIVTLASAFLHGGQKEPYKTKKKRPTSGAAKKLDRVIEASLFGDGKLQSQAQLTWDCPALVLTLLRSDYEHQYPML